MDPLGLAALGAGGIFLVLWYVSSTSGRQRHTEETTRRFTTMVDDKPRQHRDLPAPVARDVPAELVRALPIRLDEAAVRQCVTDNLTLFRAADSLFGKFMIALRDRYHTRWEVEMLDRIEQKLAAEVRVMEAGTHHAAVRGTLQERTRTEILQTKTQHLQAQSDYAKVQSEAPHARRVTELEGENRVLKAQLDNEALKRQLADARDKKEDAPKEKRSFAEQQKEQLSRLVEQAEARISSLIEFYRFCDEVAARCKEANLKPKDEAYEHIMNLLDGIRERLTK